MSLWIPCVIGGWRLGPSCHLFADTLEELHAFAARLGMRCSWFQDRPGKLPHYDLTRGRRRVAVHLGAIEASDELLMEHVRRHRQQATGQRAEGGNQ